MAQQRIFLKTIGLILLLLFTAKISTTSTEDTGEYPKLFIAATGAATGMMFTSLMDEFR